MNNSNIPTDADFAAASAHMEWISRGTDDASTEALAWLSASHEMFRVYVIAEREESIRVFTFFEHQDDCEVFISQADAIAEYEELIHNALTTSRKVVPEAFSLHFEYDSAENVDANLDGDFYRRMS